MSEPNKSESKIKNRWLVVIGALLIQFCLGAIYAWSVFTPALTTKSPYDVINVYSPQLLGLSKEKFEEMQSQLDPLKKELNQVIEKIKNEKDATKKEELQKQQEELLTKIDTVITQYISNDKLNELLYKFTKTQSQAIFSAGLAFFAIVMVIAGRWLYNPKVGPQKLAISGGIVLGLGYLLAGLVGGKSFPLHLIFIGILGGSGIGLAYVVPIAVSMRWFPDKKGLITGFAVAGFGFGALAWVQIAGSWGNLIADLGLSTTFSIYGIIFGLLVLIGSIWMIFPPEGWKPEGWEPPKPQEGGKVTVATTDFTYKEMLKTPQFYMIWLVFVFSAGAGLMSIGLMKLFPMTALVQNGIDPISASSIAGLAMALFFSLANGLGRIIWGSISDKIGRKLSIIIMTLSQGIFVIAFTYMAGIPALLYLGATLIGFNFGGNFSLFPTITSDLFGNKYVGQNYPWVFLAYGVGGIFGPMLGGKLGDLGNFPLAFIICGILCLIAGIITSFVRPPKKEAQ